MSNKEGNNERKMSTIDTTKENYKAIKKLYDQAIADNKDSFMHEGTEILTSFAKYLLEHMRNVLDKHK